MADKERLDIKLDTDLDSDNDFEELDKLLNSGFNEDNDTEDIDNSRNPVERILKKTTKVVGKELSNVGAIAEKVSDSVMDNLPESLKVYVDAGKDVSDKIGKSVSSISRTSRSIGYGILGKIEDMTPDGKFKDKLDRLKNAIKPEEEHTYYYREETDEEKALKQVTNILGEQLEHNKYLEQEKLKLEQLSLKSNTDYLREQTIALNTLRDYTLNVVNKYHRKSLELQIRQLIVSDKLYTLLNNDVPVMSKQLEAIVKNTSIPDMVKLNTGEYLKEKFRQSMVTKGLDILKGNQLVKVIKGKAEEALTNTLGNVLGNADQIQSMLSSGMDTGDLGADKTEMMISMALDSLVGSMTNKSLGFLKNRLKKSKYAGDMSKELSKLETDPKRALVEIADKLDKKGGKASFLAGMARSISDSMTNNLGNTDLMEGGLNEPSYLDNKMKKSVTVVIPTLLSKILAEVVSIRKGDKTRGEELVYDYNTNKFTNTTKLKRELIKAQIDTAKSIKTGVSTKLGELFKLLDPNKILSKTDKENIAKIIIPYLINGGSTDIRYMIEDGIDKELKSGTANKFRKLIDNILKSKKIEDAVRITDISGVLKDIKISAIERSEGITRTIDKISKLGRADVAGKLGLLNKNDYSSISGNNLVKALSKYTDREINKHGIDITEIPDEIEEKDTLLSKVGKKIKEKTTGGIKNIKDSKAFKDLSNKIDDITRKEEILKNMNNLKSNIFKTAKDAMDKTTDKIDNIKLRRKISKIDNWSTNRPENLKMFKDGGYTGEGNPDEIAGIVHKDEHVINKPTLSKLESITKKLTSLFTKENRQSRNNVNKENVVDKLINTTQQLVSDIDLNFIKGKAYKFNLKHVNINTSGLELGVKNAIKKVRATEAITKLKHNIRDIRKMIADGSIDKIIKNQLANIPLPTNKEEALGIYKKVMNAIDPTGKLFREMTNSPRLLDKLNKLHIEAIAEQQDKLIKETGDEDMSNPNANVNTTNMSFKDKMLKKLNDFKSNILDKTKKGAFNVLSKTVRGFKKGLSPIKDDFGELIHDEYGNVKIPSLLKTIKFLGKSYVNTAKATGYATKELYGGTFGGIKNAVGGGLKYMYNRHMKNKSITIALRKAPLPDELKKEIANGNMDFEEALDYLEGEDKERYAKWLEAKYKHKSKIGSIFGLAKSTIGGAGKLFTGSAKLFGKKYKEGADTAAGAAKSAGKGILDTALHGKSIKDIISTNRKDREEHRTSNKKERDKKLEEVVKNTNDKVTEVENKTDKIYKAIKGKDNSGKSKKIPSYMDWDKDGDRDGNWKDRLKKLYSHKKEDDKETKSILEKAKDSSKWGWLIAPLMFLAGKIKSIFHGGIKFLLKETGKLLWKPFKWLGSKLGAKLTELGSHLLKGLGKLPSMLGDLIHKIPGIGKVTEVAGKAWGAVKNVAGRAFEATKSIAGKAWGKVAGIFKSKTAIKAEEKIGEKLLKKEVKAGAIKLFLHKLKKILIEKLGMEAAVKFFGKIAARFVPFAGWAMLAYDAVKVAWYMFHDHMSFKSAVSMQILGFDIFAKDKPAIDPETGEPIKPHIPEDKIKKEENKLINSSPKIKSTLDKINKKDKELKKNINKNIKNSNINTIATNTVLAKNAMATKAKAESVLAKDNKKISSLATKPNTAPIIPLDSINKDSMLVTNDILSKSLIVQKDMLSTMQQLLKVNLAMFKITIDNKPIDDDDKNKMLKQLSNNSKHRIEEPPNSPAFSYSHYK